MKKTMSSFWQAGLGSILAAVVALPIAAASAQTAAPDAGPDTGDAYTPRGARLGGFLFYPKLTVTETYDDNIFKAETGEKDDFITQISPNLSLRSDWNRHALRFDANADVGRYADSDDDDYEDYDLRARGRADASRALTISGEARYRWLHEARGGDDVATDASAPVEYTRGTAGLEAEYKPNRFGLTVGTTLDDYDYDDNGLLAGGTTNNDDRDRTVWTGSVKAGYEIQEGYEAYLKGVYNDRNYDSAVDDNNFNRDSDGYNVQAGLAVDLTRLVRADVAIGWMEQEYSDANLEDASGWSGDARVRWSVTELTTLRFTANRAINETTTANASGIVYTSFGAGVDHELLRNLILKADARYANSDYQGLDREDDRMTFSAGADYKMNRNFFGGLGYTYEDRDSNTAGNDYTDNIVRLTVGAQF